MNLKVLSISVLILAILSGIVAWTQRPSAPTDTDPRIGTSLLDGIDVNTASTIAIADTENRTELQRDADGAWSVETYHGFPADADKLRRLMQDLNDATIARVVTRNPERAARLNIGEVEIDITAGESHQIAFGQNASRGGRYLRFAESDEAPVYLTAETPLLDAQPQNWVQTDLTAFEPTDIQAATITLADGSVVEVKRDSATAPWTAENEPAGKQLRLQPITSLLTGFSNLRFTETAELTETDVIDAAAASRDFVLTTFEGETLTLQLGRRAEQTIVNAEPETTPPDLEAEPDSTAEEALEESTETLPAGRVFAVVEGPASLAPLAAFNDTRAFEVSSFSFTSLPADAETLWEDAPITDTEIDGVIPAAE
jgi:hypothetical protein